ncbi:MAG: MBL fold metallo-hydrolase [Thermomicrobiales bacterium]
MARDLQLTLLGTGTPAALLQRAGASYFVRLGDQQLLFDCGPFAVHRLLEAGSRPTEITTLFLTHLHYDHCADYGHLVLNRWDEGAGKIPELHVYGPPPVERMTESLFGEQGVWGPDLAARTGNLGSQAVFESRGGTLPRLPPRPDVTTVEAGSVVDGDGWVVRVAEVVHFQPHLICLAYRLDAAGKSIVFGGDTRPTPALTDLAGGANVLIHMCHYVTGEETDPRLTDTCSGHIEAARTARDAGVDTLVLTHITERVEKPGVRERVIHEAAEVFSGRIIFGEDLTEVAFDASGEDPI